MMTRLHMTHAGTYGPSSWRGRRSARWARAFFASALLATLALSGAASASTQGVTTTHPSNLLTRSIAGPAAVAEVRGTIVSLYQSPSSPKPYRVLTSPQSSGQALSFLVSNTSLAPYWLQVRLAMRPNGSEAWIHGSAVDLTQDNYLVQVHLSAHRLVVFNGNQAIINTAVGVGRSVLPTPTGVDDLVDLLAQPDPQGEYGPYAFGLSAFSDVLYSFGDGPGQIGLHGTDVPTSVGGNESHGCLRVSNAVVTQLARMLPLGTPVVIEP